MHTHKQLLEAGVFFYNATYAPLAKKGKFGKLVPLSLPTLDDPYWPIPDMHMSEHFGHHLFCDFQAKMKPTIDGRSHLFGGSCLFVV